MTRYELLDRIGVGGMAEIFRGKAVAAGGFEKPVAIKRILPHLSQDRRFVELLIAEAKVLSQLRHRNIVQIFDVGLGDDGKYFLVMEFVDGKDLAAVKSALEHHHQRLPVDIVMHLGAELCDALGHAHAAKASDGTPMKLVHRDISPSNILISRAGEVKLTDFGIAKRAEEATGHGGVRGKFAYISPEQARNEHIDPRSDVFSAGILLWELLTGRPLFSNLNDLDALRGVREANIPPPSSVDPNLPRELDAIIMAALAREPARRYTGALQFGSKLRSLRYSLAETSGDPAGELGRAVEMAFQVRVSRNNLPPRGEFDFGEATVIRIRTADDFGTGANDVAAVRKARQIIERFEEEETKMGSIGAGGLRIAESISPARSISGPDEPTSMGTSQRYIDPPARGSAKSAPPPDAFDGEERTSLASAAVMAQLRAASSAGEFSPHNDQLEQWQPPAQSHAYGQHHLLDSPLTMELSTGDLDIAASTEARGRARLPEPRVAKAPIAANSSVAPQHGAGANQFIAPAVHVDPAAFSPPAAKPPRLASPTLQETHRPYYDPFASASGAPPRVSGFRERKSRSGMIVFSLIALALIAALSFAITKALQHSDGQRKSPSQKK